MIYVHFVTGLAPQFTTSLFPLSSSPARHCARSSHYANNFSYPEPSSMGVLDDTDFLRIDADIVEHI